ncbi:MAG: hypothetical protein AB7V55_04605 [Oscillospiraceae bacterium]
MTKPKKSLCALLAALFLFVGAATLVPAAAAGTPPDPAAPQDAVACATYDELVAALEADVGGAIVLTDHLLIEPFATPLPDVTVPTTVYMGEYSITLIPIGEGWANQLMLGGPLTFIGTETLFVLPPETRLWFWDDLVEIWAIGENACAILCMQEETNNRNVYSKIYAVGENATGIMAHGDLLLGEDVIIASGGAVPVRCDGNVTAENSRLENTAGGPVFLPYMEAEMGQVTAYACALSTVQDGVLCPPGTMEPIAPWRSYIAQGNTEYTAWDLECVSAYYYTITYDLSGEFAGLGLEESTLREVAIEWDLSQIDPHTLGVYEVTGNPTPALDLPDFPVPPISATVTVIPQDMAWIGKGATGWDFVENTPGLELCMVSELVGATGVTAWGRVQTDDGWGPWTDYTALGSTRLDSGWGASTVWVFGLEADCTYQFYLMVEGGDMAGRTNTLEVFYSEDFGGDRDLGDRDPDDWTDDDPPKVDEPTGPSGPSIDDPDKPDPGSKVDEPNPTPTDGSEAKNPDLKPAGESEPTKPTDKQTGKKKTTQKPAETPAAPDAPTPETPQPNTAAASAAPATPVPPAATAPTQSGGAPAGKTFARQALLDLMEANPNTTALFVGDVRLALPTTTLRELLGSAQDLLVDAGISPSGIVHVAIWVDGAELDTVPGGFELSFAYPSGTGLVGTFSLLGPGGELLPATWQDGSLSATVTALGEYTVLFEGEALAPSAPAEPMAPPPAPSELAAETQDSGALTALLLSAGFLTAGGAVAIPVGIRIHRRRKL